MKNKIILILSGLIVVNTVLGDVGGEEDVFETKEDVFGSNEAQLVHQETATTNNEVKEKPTIANEELKVQVISDLNAFFYGNNGFVIKKGMDQYIIECVIHKVYMERVLVKLRPLHTDKSKKLGKKPIVFKQLTVYNLCDIPTEESDEFSIESFQVGQTCYNLSDFEAFYNALSKFGKPIVFDKVFVALKDEIEKKDDLSNCKIYYSAHITSFDDYLKFAKLDVENLSFGTIRVAFTPFSEEQMLKEKLKLALKYLKGESIEELKKGVELLLGLNLKQKIRQELRLHKLSKAVSDEEFIEILNAYKLREEIKEFIKVLEKLKTELAEEELFPITEEKELRKQLHAYVHDNRVKEIEIEEVALTNNYTEGSLSIPIEYATSFKLGFDGDITKTQLINPKNAEAILWVLKTIVMMENVTCDTLFCGNLNEDIGKNVSCKTIICYNWWTGLKPFANCLDKIKNLETVYIGVDSEYFNKIKTGVGLSERFIDLKTYLTKKNISLRLYDENLEKSPDGDEVQIEDYLVGYVNVKNKPEELSNEEWDQVLVLKQEFKELIKKIQSESIEAPAIEETN